MPHFQNWADTAFTPGLLLSFQQEHMHPNFRFYFYFDVAPHHIVQLRYYFADVQYKDDPDFEVLAQTYVDSDELMLQIANHIKTLNVCTSSDSSYVNDLIYYVDV